MPRILVTPSTWHFSFIAVCEDTQREIILLEKYPQFRVTGTRER
jgi:hypothetical protein